MNYYLSLAALVPAVILFVRIYQLDRIGQLVVVNADEQSHVAAAQESAGGRDLRE